MGPNFESRLNGASAEKLTPTKKEAPKIDSNQQEQYARVLEERFELSDGNLQFETKILTEGVKALRSFLERIRTQTGKLPSVIVLPDTSARPLAYVIRPLLEELYRHQRPPFPAIRFVTPYQGKQRQIYDVSNALDKTVTQLKKSTSKVEKQSLLRPSKYFSSANTARREKALGDMNLLDQSIDKHLHTLEASDSDFENTLSSRVSSIFKEHPRGAVLVIDDIVKSGGTLSDINDAIQRVNPMKPSYFFSFVMDGKTGPDGSVLVRSGEERLCPTDHFSYGLNKEGYERILESNSHEIDTELINTGFFWRNKKKEGMRAIGVTKTPMDVTRVHADTLRAPDVASMQTLRKFLQDVGKQALRRADKEKNAA